MDGIPLPRDELERLMFFESAREKAAADYELNPQDPDTLTRWGGALLELAQFQQGHESVEMVEAAESKLEEALKIDPKRHNTLWCLGNAQTSHGFLLTEPEKANVYFEKASKCFHQALDEEPHNELYKKALEMSAKAPDLHQELQKQLMAQQAVLGSTSGSGLGSAAKGQKKNKSSDLKYDVLGWIVLAVGVFAWIGMAKSAMQNAPPPDSK